jgi:hypothetical protein
MSVNVDALKGIATLIEQIGDAETNTGYGLDGSVDVVYNDGEIIGSITFNGDVEPTFSTP